MFLLRADLPLEAGIPGFGRRLGSIRTARARQRDRSAASATQHARDSLGRLKTEMFVARDRLSTNIEEFVMAVDAYIRWCNETRIKSSLGFRSPAEHRRRLGIAA